MDGDGREEALVGVVKATRFYPEKARRLFIFHLVHGKVRPLWLGSRLGGRLVDFRFADGRVRSVEQTDDGTYAVMEWHWRDFGLQFHRYIAQSLTLKQAQKMLTNNTEL